ncbi:MAG: Phospholipid/glycerol acyltransferase [Limisphaerales bacterium]|nr:MAG: Phospholipid/glycerol acyltransferase [Limisphaerales bacterium]KAG0509880.1 MAG: Phospholipid/glycerol acyltransferase [Limisphaerales bacterium]TXT50649.1 MAG: Phospholipid/glycerol acyltransferase [Limisphaerales bacterium]
MKPVYRLTWLFARAVFALYHRWRVFNAERVPLTGPVILAANHASFIDPPLIGSGLHRPINYLTRDSLFRFPGFGWYLRTLHCVPVDRDGAGAAGLRAILDRLLNGGAIILFPEGTRTSDGNLQPARSGVGLTVIKSDAPVVPVRVFGTFEAWSRHQKFPRPRRVMVKYGVPMDFKALREEAKTCTKPRLKEIYQEIADQLMAAIAKLEPVEDAPSK